MGRCQMPDAGCWMLFLLTSNICHLISVLLSSDSDVIEAQVAHSFGFIDIAQVCDFGAPHKAAYAFHIEGAELIPLGNEDQRVGPRNGPILVFGIRYVRQYLLCFRDRDRIISANGRALFEKAANNIYGWSFAHVVRLGFEGKAQYSNTLIAQLTHQFLYLRHHRRALSAINLYDSINDQRLAAKLL